MSNFWNGITKKEVDMLIGFHRKYGRSKVDSTYITEFWIKNHDEHIEVHRCPQCAGILGIDSTFLDQVDTSIICPMCTSRIELDNPKKMKGTDTTEQANFIRNLASDLVEVAQPGMSPEEIADQYYLNYHKYAGYPPDEDQELPKWWDKSNTKMLIGFIAENLS